MRLATLLNNVVFSLVLIEGGTVLDSVNFCLPLFLLITIAGPLFSRGNIAPLFFVGNGPMALRTIICNIFVSIVIIKILF